MPNQKPRTAKAASDDIRTAYQAAVQLIIYEGQLTWWSLAVFMAFATLLIAGAASTSFLGVTNAQLVAMVSLLFAIAGVISSLMWWSMLARGRRYYEYWVASARALEQQMGDTIQTLQRGQLFAEGGKVQVDNKVIAFRFIERIPMKSIFHLFYASFTLIFFCLVAMNSYRVVVAF
mgnify:CR=1 FL=1